jgi:uncharacterized protein (DUF2141 family)
MKIKTNVFLMCIVLFASISLQAQPATFTVSGTISFQKQGAIYIMLLTEQEYTNKAGANAVYRLKITPSARQITAQEVSFEYHDVPKGNYCINCFQDTNGNGQLDKGLFGPTEPWCLYREVWVLMGRPVFKDICFALNEDLAGIEIRLK